VVGCLGTIGNVASIVILNNSQITNFFNQLLRYSTHLYDMSRFDPPPPARGKPKHKDHSWSPGVTSLSLAIGRWSDALQNRFVPHFAFLSQIYYSERKTLSQKGFTLYID
jgi:hypothetical protein